MPSTVRLLAAGLCVAAAASAVHAQARRVQAVPNTGAPSAAARSSQAAPNPAGLRPPFPAGLSSGSGAAQSSDPIASRNSPGTTGTNGPTGTGSGTGSGTGTVGGTTGTGGTGTDANAPGTPVNPSPIIVDANGNPLPVVNAGGAVLGGTAVMGAGATVRGPGQTTGGAGGFSATDVARSFYFADANHDGELTRSEANRLSLRSMTFEEMDRNFDGIISRFEYDDSMR
jgi:hypothetical protein